MQGEEIRRLMTFEVDNIRKGEDIVQAIKAQRIRWHRHLKRMQGERSKQDTDWKLIGNRSRRRRKSRWEDQVIGDIRNQQWKRKLQARN